MGDVNEGVVRVVPSFGRESPVVLVLIAIGFGVGSVALGWLEPSGAGRALFVAFGIVFAVAGLAAGREQMRTLQMLERLSIEPIGVRLGDVVEPWSSVSIEGSAQGIDLEVAGTRARLRRDQVANWLDVVRALRERARPDRWRVRERRRPPAVLWRRHAARPPAAPASSVPASTYRSLGARATDLALPGWWTETPRRLRSLALLGAIALALGGPMFAHYRPEPPVRQCGQLVPDEALAAPSAVDLAGFVLGMATTVTGLGGLVLAWGLWYGHRHELHARAWVGPDAVGDGRGGARSRDGRRHVHIEREDPLAIGFVGISMEELDAAGLVARTRFGWAASEDLPSPTIHSRLVASLPRAVDSGRHFVLGSSGPFSAPTEVSLGAARVLVLDVREDGVLLLRFSERREHVGATWHATRFEAEDQIADEYGARDLPFREAPLDGAAISFFAYA